MMDDKASNRAPKADVTHERIAALNSTMDSLTPPTPEVDVEKTAVPRSEMMGEMPSMKDKVTPWRPGA